MKQPRSRFLALGLLCLGHSLWAGQAVAAQASVVPAHQVEWAELRARGFAADWEFPRHKADGTPYPCIAFENSVFELARQPILAASEGRPALWLGDLVREFSAHGWNEKQSEARLKGLKKQLSKDRFARLEDLLECWDLYGRKWSPRKSSMAHGMHFGKQWEFKKKEWTYAKGQREVESVAQIVLADIAAIKSAEANYSLYWSHTKHDWEKIEVDLDSRLQVRDEAGDLEAASLTIDFKFDLPFPFSTAKFKLYTLNRKLEDGRPVLYLHGVSDDLYWLSGYDLYEPIRDRNGEWVGTLMIRVFGLDLDGVPDGRGDRHDNLRGQFGNVRRDAERLFRVQQAAKEEPGIFPYVGKIPDYEVRDGRRAKR